MEREIAKAKEQSRLENKQREEQMRRAEEMMRRESLADYEKKKAALAAETARVERMTKEKYDQDTRQREQEQLALMLKKSAEEALSRQKEEEEELQKALMESMRLTQSPKVYHNQAITTTKKDVGGAPRTERTSSTKSAPPPLPPMPKQLGSIPSPPPMPKSMAAGIPSPPPMPSALSPKPAVSKKTPSSPKAAEAPRDWSLPLVGEQEYGHLKIGNRSQPIHPSQKVQSPNKPAQLSPTGPSPEARLRGVIAPDLPTLRQAQGQVTPTDAPRANFRRPSGTRRVSETPIDPLVDPKLQEILAKRRQWEPVEEENASNLSITPSQSASNFGSPASTPTASDLGKTIVRADSPQEMMREESTLQARRLNKVEFDAQRKTGWKQE